MVLENFIVDAPIVWDRVGKKIFENPHVKQGRKMRVQITNAGMVEDLSGYTLALGWKHTVSGVDGLDVFEDSSEANVGIFEMAYTENLMTNLGNLKASLVLTSVEDMVVAESNDFYVKVDDSPFGANAEQGVGSYTRLAQILLNEEIRQEAYLRNEALVGSIDDKFDAFIQTNIVQEEVAEVFNNLEETYAQDLVSVKNGLEQVVTIGNFTGANDTTKFFNACSNAVANKKILQLTKDITLDATVQNMFEIPSIEGNGFTLTVIGALHLYVGSSCNFIRNLKIIDTNNYVKTDFVITSNNKNVYDKGYLFETLGGYTIDGLDIANIKFKGTSACVLGDYRTKGVFYLKGNSINATNVKISDARYGFYINDADGSTPIYSNVNFNNIKMFNVELGIGVNRTSEVNVRNVSLINTKTQMGNYTVIQGSDVLLFLYCQNVQISTLYTKFPLERTIYFIMCSNVTLNQFIVDSAGGGSGGGIKFLGVLNVGHIDSPTENIKVSNGFFIGEGRHTCFELYNAKNVEISNITVNATVNAYDFFVQLSNNSLQIYIHDCTVKNITNYFLYGTLSSLIGTYALTHFYDTITVSDCYILNPVSITSPTAKELFYLYNPESKNLEDDTFFKFSNFTFKNNTVIQTLDGTNLNVNGIETTSKLSTLLPSLPVKGLFYANNRVRGSNELYGFVRTLPSSINVVIKNEIHVGQVASLPHSTYLNCSYGSEIDFIQYNFSGVYKAKAIYNNVNPISESSLNNITDILMNAYPTNSEVKYLIYTKSGTRFYSGIGEIFFDDGSYSKFKVQNNAGTLTLTQIAGDGTLSSNKITFGNGTSLEFGFTYKDFLIRSGSTAVKYTISFKGSF